MADPGRSTRLGIPLALIAAIAVIGAILQATWEGRERPASGGARGRPRRPARGWSSVRVEARPFDAGGHEDLGERLYGWNCMPCHGAEGRGDGPVSLRLGLRPRDFTRGAFKLKSSHPDEMPFDEDLFRSISAGFPQGAMPPFEDFTAEERWALVDHVKSLAQVTLEDGRVIRRFEAHPAKTRISIPPDSSEGDPVQGSRLFVSVVQCARCHGERGRGDGPAAPGLRDEGDRPVAMPDFAQGRLSFKAGIQPEDVYRVLTTGMAGTAMPSFLSLAEKDRRDLAAYVTGLFQPVRPGEELFLTLGCIHCHTVAKGRLVGPDLSGIAGRRDRTWLRRWLKDPPAMLASDDQARAMAREYPVPMPSLNLSEADVDQLVDYLTSLPLQTGK
jgi:cytochrome c oxidase cbb3-type subunit 2